MSSIRETAEGVVSQIAVGAWRYCSRQWVIRLVEEALRNTRTIAFDQGYVCAVANIMNLHGEEVIAREVLNQNRPKDWSIIDAEDMKALRPIFDHEAAQAEIGKLKVSHDSKTS